MAGQAKGGFYPAPAAAVALAAAQLRPPPEPFALLDPCAGKGAAVRQLAEALGCPLEHVHAIELDEGRAAECKAALPGARVLAPASFFGCRARACSFSLVWCNPPFDHELGGGRVEAKFLERATEWLKPGGVLALVCPESASARWDIQSSLMQWYERLSVHPFPEECRQYQEVIVLGVKRKQPVSAWDQRWTDVCEPPGRVDAIPPGRGPRVFEKVELTDPELARALAASPLRRQLAALAEPALPSPPLALGSGHIALLLAAGHLDGLVEPPGEPPHVVRGTARKVQYVSHMETTANPDGSETTKTVLSERITLTVRAVDQTGTIRTFTED
jgi:hypothetical protein